MSDYTIENNVLIRYLGNSEHVTIPDGVETIGRFAFKQSRKTLKSVTIPDSVHDIGDGAFDTCINLEAVSFGKNIKRICNGAFNSCKSLTSISLPEGLERIDLAAFQSCASLKDVYIPDSVTRIGNSAFYLCNIKDVSIPAGCNCDYTAFDRSCSVTRRNSEPQQSRELTV